MQSIPVFAGIMIAKEAKTTFNLFGCKFIFRKIKYSLEKKPQSLVLVILEVGLKNQGIIV